jgi:TonB-linked SusC/RagA family outer membrane protein
MRNNLLLLKICVTAFLVFRLMPLNAQNSGITVKGTVRSDSSYLEGVSVTLKSNPEKGVRTNEKGAFTITAPSNGTLVFSFVGYKTEEVEVRGEPVINVTMKASENTLGEVAVVAYGTQKRSSMVSSITTVDPKELKGPTGNLTTMLAGKISGLVAYQRSGEPGRDNASFFIRGITTFGSGKVDPLILIDGMESTSTDLARLQPDDIAGFSVLKDATAASLYGARGANGVLLITTKLGKEGSARFNVRMENSVSGNTQNFKLADNITYMKLANEAVITRTPLGVTPYSEEKIAQTAKPGADPYLYPSNDWMKKLIKNYTTNQRYNLNLSGGGKVAQYYVAGTYNIDNGILNIDKINNFNGNIKLRNYEVRSNVNINVTSSTQLIIRTSGQFDDYRGPVSGKDDYGNIVSGGAYIFNQVLQSNPVLFPAIYPASFQPKLSHPLFGNALSGASLYSNPYARAVAGYQQYNTSTMLAQAELKQNFNFITPGLSARFMVYTQRYSYFDVSRAYSPFYYSLSYDQDTKEPKLSPLNTDGTEYLSYVPGAKILNTTSYMEAAVNYSRSIKKHSVSGMLITTLRNYLNANAGDLQSSLPYRNQGVSGRFTYGYDNRYLAEFNFGYNGSERFAKNNRFGFFPSVGFAWNMHEESFFRPLLNVVNSLKIRATYGLVGNDQIGSNTDRFYYLSNVNMDDATRGYTFGENYNYNLNGISVTRYANNDITWEKSYKTNIGFDAKLFNSLNITVDIYKEHRKNILMDRAYVPSTMGLNSAIRANVGEAEGKGIDVQVDFNKTVNKYVWLQGRGTFTYATSKVLVNEEPSYPGERWRSHVGYPLSQQWGLVAERLFVDDKEISNSPTQNFGEVKGGDIKYRDINGNGQIDAGDNVPIGYPTTPEITFGYGISVGYKNFDFSVFFEGNARVSFFIDSKAIQPFKLKSNYESQLNQSNLLKVIADDHWSESNRNVYAFWPRLSNYEVQNNTWTSTWWMHDGTFMRLKSAEIGYSFSTALLKRFHFSNARFYINGSNLFVISKFKLWDPEMGGNGLGYPVQRVFNMGVNFGL